MTEPLGQRSSMSLRRELVLLGLMLLAFVVVNALFAARSPVVWQDEVQLVDPAANYLTGRGFTSTAWDRQTCDETFAGNSPLYSWLLVGWMWVFGVGITSARSLSYALMAVVALLVWAACRRSGLVKTPPWRLWLAGVLLTGHTVTFSYRSGRFDATMMALAALALLAVTIEHRAWRLGALAAISASFAWTGLHLLPYSAAMMGCVILVSRGRFVPETVAVGAGGAAGLGSMYWIYSAAGLWQAIGGNLAKQSAVGGKGVGSSLLERLAPTIGELPRLMTVDRSSAIILALVLILAGRDLLRRRPVPVASVLCVLCYVVIPIFLRVLAKFPTYMGWMVHLPVAIGAASVFERAWLEPAGTSLWHWLSGRRMALLGWAVAIGASFPGLTGRLTKTADEWKDRDYAPLVRFVQETVKPGETVFAWWSAYYAIHPLPVTAYYPAYVGEARAEYSYVGPIRENEKVRVTKMLVPPAEFEYSARMLGGTWTDTGREFSAGIGPNGPLYQLRLYVREGADVRGDAK